MKINWKVFCLSFITQFVISSLIFTGIKAPEVLNFLSFSDVNPATSIMMTLSNSEWLNTQTQSLINPLPEVDTFEEKVKPQLQKISSDFRLHKSTSILPAAYAAGEYDQAKAYIVANLDTGEVLVDKKMGSPLPIASITKLMTAVVSLDLVSPDELVTVSAHASTIIPTKIGVVPGQKMEVQELLHAALMTSANDAVEALRDGIDAKYGENVFVEAMNAKAKFLGLKNTHFDNPQGFDGKGNYSSVADVAILAQYALKNYPLIAEIVRKDYQFLEADGNHKQFDLYNWNGLLGVYPGAAGIKIGNTEDASYTTVVCSQRGEKHLVAVLLGAPGVLERDLWTSQILDQGFYKVGINPVNITTDQLKAKYSTWKYWN